MNISFLESDAEQVALEWLKGLGNEVLFGPDVEPGMDAAERGDCGDAILSWRLRDALARLNPDPLPEAEQICAFRNTWERGIHSYLMYRRDRLPLSRELLRKPARFSCRFPMKREPRVL